MDKYFEKVDRFYKLKNRYETTKKKKCINCGKLDGTLFDNKNDKFIIKCLNDTPCTNEEFDKKRFALLNNVVNDLHDKIENIKSDIIKIKLDIIFDYVNEDDAINKFTLLKNNLNELEKLYRIYKTEYLNVVDNKEKKEQIREEKTNLFVNIERLKELINEYKKTDNINLVKTASEIYISDIAPIAKKIRKLKYVENIIDDVDDNYFLIQKPYTIKQLEVI